jgi:cytochrome c
MALPDHQDRDDQDPRRPRWLAWAIGVAALVIVLGMVNLAWLMITGRLAPTDKAGALPPAENQSVGQASRSPPMPSSATACLRCHGIERPFVGPAFVRIAERHRDRADAQPYLARKVVEGSVGEWGRVIMPRQVGVTDATAHELAQWILSMAPPASASATAAQRPASAAAAP